MRFLLALVLVICAWGQITTAPNTSGGGTSNVVLSTDVAAGPSGALLWDCGNTPCIVELQPSEARRYLDAPTTQALAAVSDTIVNTYRTVLLTSSSALVMTSTPTISTTNSVAGDIRMLCNTNAANTVTLQDKANLASSAISNRGDNVVLYSHTCRTFLYDGTYWALTSPPANVVNVKTLNLDSPVTGDTNKFQMTFPIDVTIQRIWCSTDTGTVTIQFDERAEATPNTAGTDVLASALVCDNNTEVSTSFTNASIASHVPMNLQITATSGSPTIVRIHVKAQ